MKVELSRFRVKPGKSAVVDEWLQMLNSHMNEVVQTLDREQMKLEVIFREIIGGNEYLYWFSIQGEEGSRVKPHPLKLMRSILSSGTNVSTKGLVVTTPNPKW